MSPQRRFILDRRTGLAASLALHISVMVLGGLAITRPVEYAVEAGYGGVEVSLEAGPVDESLEAPLPNAAVPEPEIADADAVPAPEQPKTAERPKALAGQGADKITFYSAGGGAVMDGMPNYLRNPAPAYPAAARRKGRQGLVMLAVHVSRDGRAADVRVEQSSGFEDLDEAAQKAVRGWRFKPAEAGGVRIETAVRVPVRFQLEERL